jgi:lysophospholipase L1-like esterase
VTGRVPFWAVANEGKTRRRAVGRIVCCVLLAACGGEAVQAMGTGGVASACTGRPDEASTLVTFADRAGGCLPAERLLGIRCSDLPQQLVRGYGTPRERRYLGGRFAVPIEALPAGASRLGRADGQEVFEAPGDPSWLFARDDEGTARWLLLPRDAVVQPPALAVIGDSIADGARDAIAEQLLGWTVTVDAEIGRGSGGGVAVAAPVATATPDVVVVELGTNDQDPESFRANAQAILDALRAVSLVLWQTIRGPDTAAEVNTEIRDLVGRYPNAALADWHASVDPEVLDADGVHPLPGHESEMAELLGPLLWKWYAAARATGGSGCVTDETRR